MDEDRPFASRWTFYIGIDGRILYVDKQVSPAAQGKRIIAKLAELGIPRRSPSGAPFAFEFADRDPVSRSRPPSSAGL